MELQPLDVKEYLLQSNEEFRKLAQQHSGYDEKLSELLRKSFLSEDEKVEEVRLKKLKLRVKDQMEVLIQRHNQASRQRGFSK